MPIQAIVFDFDGTLIDASEAIWTSFTTVLREHQLQEPPQAWVKARIGRPLVEIFSQIDPGADVGQIEAYVEQYRQVFFPLGVALSRPLPGAREAMERLSSRIGLGIATSRRADTALRILDGLGLRSFFGAVIGIEHVERAKPDPEPVLLALQQLGSLPAHAAMVGDTTDDILAGRSAGTRAIGVTTGAHDRAQLMNAGAHLVVDGLLEVADHVLSGARDPTTGRDPVA
jgi:pyrophosphatase PpaX